MSDQLYHVGRAAQTQGEADQKTRDILIEAGYALLEALFDPEEWPAELEDRANEMMARLRTAGTIVSTVRAMDSLTVIRLVVDIRILAADIEVARIKGLVRSMSQVALLSGEDDS